MEWQQILGFYHTARLGSFTKAAEATLRTQSALSQQIKSLEEEFGSELFDRIGKKKLKLTPAGERFYRFAESVLQSYDNLKEEIHNLQDVQKGHLRVAAPFTTLYHLFPERIKGYLESLPQVELTILDRPQATVIELLRDGEIDFGLVLESAVPTELTAIRWQKVETVLLVPEGHPLSATECATWEQIAGYPLILPPKSAQYTGRTLLEEQLRKLGLAYRIVMESSNVELSSIYVEIGLGISFATIVKDLPALKYRKLQFNSLSHYFEADHIAIVSRKGKVLAPYKNAFVHMLLDNEAGVSQHEIKL